MHFPKLNTKKELAEFCHNNKWACKLSKHEICKRILKDIGYKVGLGHNYCKIYNELDYINDRVSPEPDSIKEYCETHSCSINLYNFLEYNEIYIDLLDHDYNLVMKKVLKSMGYRFNTNTPLSIRKVIKSQASIALNVGIHDKSTVKLQ